MGKKPYPETGKRYSVGEWKDPRFLVSATFNGSCFVGDDNRMLTCVDLWVSDDNQWQTWKHVPEGSSASQPQTIELVSCDDSVCQLNDGHISVTDGTLYVGEPGNPHTVIASGMWFSATRRNAPVKDGGKDGKG